MRVSVLAHTVLNDNILRDAYGFNPYSDESVSDADALAESAGRICYRSFSRPNPKTATNAGYLANILNQQHYSVLEHSSVTFLVRGVSRALLTELTRHRHLSFSVVSQRYVDYSDSEPVIPPAIREDAKLESAFRESYAEAVREYEAAVAVLMANGKKRKQAREAARAILPNAAPVDMVVTANIRGYRDMLAKRHHIAADAELQILAHKILMHLRELAPNSVQDIPNEPYGSAQ